MTLSGFPPVPLGHTGLMRHSDVLAIVQAGGRGSRMEVLTDRRAKPALPFAGGNYQLIDFPLSNLHHSHIDDVWLCVQYRAESLTQLVAGGRPWDLDRTSGGLRIVMPEQTDAPPETEDASPPAMPICSTGSATASPSTGRPR